MLRNVFAARENQIHDMLQILGDLVMKVDRKKKDMKCGSITAYEASDTNIHNESLTVDDTCNRMEDGEGNTVSVLVSRKSYVNFQKITTDCFVELKEKVIAELEEFKAEFTQFKTEFTGKIQKLTEEAIEVKEEVKEIFNDKA